MRHPGIAGRRSELLGLLGDLPILWEEGGGAELNIVVRSPFKPFPTNADATRRYGWY